MRDRSPSRTRCMIRCFAAWTAERPNASNGTSSSRTSPIWKSGSSQRASSKLICEAASSTSSTTRRNTTTFMMPSFSSIVISEFAVGPYPRCMAA